MDPITGLAIGRVGIGVLSLLSPTLAARLFLLDPKANPQLAPVTRMFGSREIAVGALTLASRGAARRRLVTVGIAIDGADALAGLAALRSGSTGKPAALALTAVAAGAVVAGVQGLDD